MQNWIRRKIMPDIMKAIRASDRSTYVFYIVGEGGEGKTVLLRQIGIELGSSDGASAHFPWSGILDLYHPDVNTNSGLEGYLSRALERASEFQPFRDERDAYMARREAGVDLEVLEEYRIHLSEVFAQCLNSVTLDRRVVIALDTVERIQYEMDQVQQICGIEEESTTVKPWLLDQLTRWQNCVVLLAGRPERPGKYLERALAGRLEGSPHVRYERRELMAFDEGETLEFLTRQEASFPALGSLDESIRRRVHKVTGGRPIRLELILNVIQHGLGFDRLWRELETASADEALEKIDHLLIKLVMEGEADPTLRDILHYLAVARRGLDAELLQDLAGSWDLDACQRRLEAVGQRSFVKRRPDDGRLFLHDQIYRFCDQYLLQPEDVQGLSHRIAAWYDRKATTSSTDSQAARTKKEQHRQHDQVESLLYRLRADPRAGYDWYAQQAESAIRAMEVGFDMRLRNELLAFLQSDSPIDLRILRPDSVLRTEIGCDCASRWAMRYSTRGRPAIAVGVAESVLAATGGPCPAGDPRFRWAHANLKVQLAEALIYLGRTDEAARDLEQTIARLESGEPPDLLAQQDPRSPVGWRHNAIRGRAHNNLGYAHWMQGHYELALREFRVALVYFRASDILEETANTSDNMGRVYAALYRRSQAEALVEDGLQLRRNAGRAYRAAFSLTSKAIVHLAFGEPHRARRMAEEALATCEGLEVPRGVGLTSLVLGRSFRHLGALWAAGVYGPEDCAIMFREALRHLNRAIVIFEQQVQRPVRLIEAYNELGCTYREWAAMARNDQPDSPLARSLARDAIQNLTKALLLAEKENLPIMYADSSEDLSQTYFQREDFDNADVWLHRSEDTVPNQYKVAEGKGLKEIPVAERIEEFWQSLGKIELLRGHLAYERGMLEGQGKISRPAVEQMIQHYALAAAYFERFSGRAVPLENTFRQVHARIKRCKIEDIQYVQEQLLPFLRASYNLDPTALAHFFEDTFGLMMPPQVDS